MLILYHETNILHVQLSARVLTGNQLLDLAAGDASSDVFNVLVNLSCGGIKVMVSRETAPSLFRIALRVSSLFQEQKRKLRSRLVTLRTQEQSFTRPVAVAPVARRVSVLGTGRIAINGNTLTIAFFQNSFNDVDWILLSAERFDLSFLSAISPSTRERIQVCYVHCFFSKSCRTVCR